MIKLICLFSLTPFFVNYSSAQDGEALNLVLTINGVVPGEGMVSDFLVVSGSKNDTLKLKYIPGDAIIEDGANNINVIKENPLSNVEIKFILHSAYTSFQKREYVINIKGINLLQRYCVIDITDITKARERKKTGRQYYVDFCSPFEIYRSSKRKTMY